MRLVQEETAEHYRALLTSLSAIQAAEGADGAGEASPEDAAAVMVHNRALLRNKRLMLAYVCVPPRALLACARCGTHAPTHALSLAGFRAEALAAPRARSNARLGRIRALRWTVGSGLPEDLSSALSPAERDFFRSYSALLGTYMGGRTGVGLNLTLDPSPPKAQKLEVRCLRDYGAVFTRDGEVSLSAGSVYYLWRDEAQPLIAEGVLEKMDDE